jgi:hypothetical protein
MPQDEHFGRLAYESAGMCMRMFVWVLFCRRHYLLRLKRFVPALELPLPVKRCFVVGSGSGDGDEVVVYCDDGIDPQELKVESDV